MVEMAGSMRIIALSLFMLLSACSQVAIEQSVVPVSVVSTPAVSMPSVVVLKSNLVFEPDHVNMGSVKEGEDAVVFLRVRNAGDVMANIVEVETSCGCSLAEPEQRLLMPGGFTRIKVVVDTFAKQGEAKKWVSLTDELGRSSKAWLTLSVRPNPHLQASSRSIFQGKCAACHFDTAKDRVKGPEIYRAVCGMCHGDQGVGAVAPSLLHFDDAHVLAGLIANGTGSHHMPGFALQLGGPLSKSQINELSQWLSTLDESDQKR